MEVKEWSKRGKMVSISGTEVFVIDEGTKENTLVILHGYGTSSIDYYKVLPELCKHYRVIIQDFVGFGFSDKPTKYYFNVLDQADITLKIWSALELKNITLLSHNYGVHIALEILARKRTTLSEIGLKNLIFLNSTISFNHVDISEDQVIPQIEFSKKILLMLTSFSFYKMKMKDFFFNADAISEIDIKARWTLMEHKNGREIIDFINNYNTESKLLWDRWFKALKENILPSKIISGKNDVIFDENEAHKFKEALENSNLHFIEDCGHYPMLEKPKELIEIILK